MIIKRYLAGSMPEAMEQIKRDLGPDAVILSTRTVPGTGWRRFFGYRQLEVTAALEEIAATKDVKDELWQEVRDLRELVLELKDGPQKVEKQEILQAVGWQGLMAKLEVDEEVGALLTKGLKEPGGGGEKEVLMGRIAQVLAEIPKENEERITCFVGPTGVGKTTTLAKLAAHASLFQNKKTVVITADTYRIGAVDQLRTYADIINVPLEVVMTPEEMLAAIQEHDDKDAIFIDTAGRPASNTEQLAELQEMLSVIPIKTVFLVLSCATKNSDMIRIAKDYQITEYDQLIFTKADETQSLGPILNIANQTRCPLAYITMGQNVPDDIVAAKPEALAALIVEALAW